MHSPGAIEIRQIEDLTPDLLKSGEVLMQILRIGVCGSDLHVYHGLHPATPYPVVQGHEYSARIVAVAPDVKDFHPGMMVTARPQLVCGTCGPCLRGQYNACQNLRVQGFQAPGVAQDLFITASERVVTLDPAMTPEQGAFVEPAAVGAHSTRRVENLSGKNVVVSGAGTIGNMVAQFAVARGAKKVLITDISDFRLDIARQCGIGATFNVATGDFDKALVDAFGTEGFQVGFEAAGVQKSLDALISNVEKGGDIVILGVYSENPVVNMYYLGEHELNMFGSMMYRHEDYTEAAKLIAEGAIVTLPLLSKKFDFEAYHDAYEYIEKCGDQVMKVMITVNE